MVAILILVTLYLGAGCCVAAGTAEMMVEEGYDVSGFGFYWVMIQVVFAWPFLVDLSWDVAFLAVKTVNLILCGWVMFDLAFYSKVNLILLLGILALDFMATEIKRKGNEENA